MAATVTPIVPVAKLGEGRWLVPSNSRATVVHIVVRSEESTRGLVDNRWACSCEATVKCAHIRRVIREWAEAEGVMA